jgi:hypothetical protein
VLGGVLLVLVIADVPFAGLAHQGVNSGGGSTPVWFSAAFGVSGFVVAWRKPGNPLGWIFLGLAVLSVLSQDASFYAVADYRLRHGGLPLGWVAVLTQPGWAPTIALAGLAVLLFPDGQLPSPRWRWVLWLYLAAAMGMQELPPRRLGAPLRSRENLQRLEGPADRGRADPVAELEQFALDPLVSPAVALGGEPLDERGDLGADRRPSCPVRVGPLAVTRRRCQRRTVPGVTSRCARTLAGKSRISAARTARSAQSSRGRGWVRRSTATSCRSTGSSASLEADDRPSRTSQLHSRAKMR